VPKNERGSSNNKATTNNNKNLPKKAKKATYLQLASKLGVPGDRLLDL